MSGRRGSTTPGLGRPGSPPNSASGRQSPKPFRFFRRGSAQTDDGGDHWGVDTGLDFRRRGSIAAVMDTKETSFNGSGDESQSTGSRPSSPLLQKFGSALLRLRTKSPEPRSSRSALGRFKANRANTAPASTTQYSQEVEEDADKDEDGEAEESEEGEGDAEGGADGPKVTVVLTEAEAYALSTGLTEVNFGNAEEPETATKPKANQIDEESRALEELARIRALTMED